MNAHHFSMTRPASKRDFPINQQGWTGQTCPGTTGKLFSSLAGQRSARISEKRKFFFPQLSLYLDVLFL